jgi:hypothetical protein
MTQKPPSYLISEQSNTHPKIPIFHRHKKQASPDVPLMPIHPALPTTQIFMHLQLRRHPTPVGLLGGPTNHILRSYAHKSTVDETAALERLKSNHNQVSYCVFEV